MALGQGFALQAETVFTAWLRFKADGIQAHITLILKSYMAQGYAFQMEIIVRARLAGHAVGEVPIVFVDRVYGKSKLGSAEVYLFAKGLLWLFLTT